MMTFYTCAASYGSVTQGLCPVTILLPLSRSLPILSSLRLLETFPLLSNNNCSKRAKQWNAIVSMLLLSYTRIADVQLMWLLKHCGTTHRASLGIDLVRTASMQMLHSISWLLALASSA